MLQDHRSFRQVITPFVIGILSILSFLTIIFIVSNIFFSGSKISIYDELIANSSKVLYISVTTEDAYYFKDSPPIATIRDPKIILNIINYIKTQQNLDGWKKISNSWAEGTGYYITFYLKNERYSHPQIFLGSNFLYRSLREFSYLKYISAQETTSLKNMLQIK